MNDKRVHVNLLETPVQFTQDKYQKNYSVLPSFEYFLVPNSRAFDKTFWYSARYLAQTLPSVIIHIYSSFVSNKKYMHQMAC